MKGNESKGEGDLRGLPTLEGAAPKGSCCKGLGMEMVVNNRSGFQTESVFGWSLAGPVEQVRTLGTLQCFRCFLRLQKALDIR